MVLMGRIDERFMDLPERGAALGHGHPSALFRPASTVVAGQRPASSWSPIRETEERGDAVIAGNERVLRARLADARFFWDQDRQHKLEDRVEALKGVVISTPASAP